VISWASGCVASVAGAGTRSPTQAGQVLDAWMAQHAFVTWVETSAPWEVEAHLLSSGLRLPLNLHVGEEVGRQVRLRYGILDFRTGTVARAV
jgi:hypothetical protein